MVTVHIRIRETIRRKQSASAAPWALNYTESVALVTLNGIA